MAHAPRFERFVRAVTAIVDAPPAGGEPALLEAARPLLADLLAHDDWLPDDCAQPGEPHYLQYLLHADPQDRFSVVSFVWGPGQKTPVHDHTVWALIGMLRGSERAQRYALAGEGAPMQALGIDTLRPGDIDAVSPAIGDIHQVANVFDDRVSISIHVYGGNIGRISRHVFDPATGVAKDFVSGYTNVPKPAPAEEARA